jgi:hypothetical protein
MGGCGPENDRRFLRMTERRSEAALKEQLHALRGRLVELHKALIDSERIEYEKSFGKLQSPHEFLKVLINDPWFAWLQPLTKMVVEIDEILEREEPIRPEEVQKMKSGAHALLEVREETDDSRRSYFEALQREPDVILAHAAVMKVLKA